MMCGECDHELPQLDQYGDPNYCPECGSEWRDKTLADVDWPITVQSGPRLNIARLVRQDTGVEAAFECFPGDVEHLIDIEVHRDGTFEVVSDR